MTRTFLGATLATLQVASRADGWGGVWAMGALALRPESTINRCGIVAAFALAIIEHESNVVFVVWPTLVRWARGDRGAVRRDLVLCGIVFCQKETLIVAF